MRQGDDGDDDDDEPFLSAVSRAGVPLVHLRPAQVSLDLQRMLASHLPSSSHLNRKPQVGCNVVLL